MQRDMKHITIIHYTPDRYYQASCKCGWNSGNCDTAREANDDAADHEAQAILNEQQHSLEIKDNG